MKKYSLLLLLCVCTFAVSAQKKIKVSEVNEKIGGGNNNALTVLIYEAKADEVEKEWKSKMKDYKAKVGTQKGEIFADDAVMSDVSANTVDVYARALDNKDGSVTLIVAYDLGGAYLTSSMHGEQFKAARTMVYDFAVNATKNAIGNQLKDAEKAQKKMEKEQEDLVKQNESLKKDIESYKEKIKEAENSLVNNGKSQESKKAEIENQKKVVESVSAKLKAVE